MNETYHKEEIQRQLHSRWLGKQFVFLSDVDSTNRYAWELFRQGEEEGITVVADSQSCGKGSHGRNWVSEKGTGIYMSFLLRPQCRAEQAFSLPVAVSLAAAKALRKETDADVEIKWPNDLLVNGKKIAGILSETSFCGQEADGIVVGIGINVGAQKFSEELKNKATTLENETGIRFSRAKLAAAVLEQIEEVYEKLLQDGSLQNMIEDYNSYLIHRDQEVDLVKGDQRETVKTIGINRKGELLIENRQGEQKALRMGEVSIRGAAVY